MEKKYQIFISSTFEDLQDERRLVTEQILNLGHIPIGMELFHASDDDQWTYIRRRISKSDYYVAIVAERYGSVDSNGMSFTEKEYRFALAENIPIAAFLLSDDARRNWPAKYVEHVRRSEIDSFRTLCMQKLIKPWSDGKDLALAVTNSLITLIDERPRPGLVPAGEVPSHVADELARLSKLNGDLAREVAELKEAQSAGDLTQDDEALVAALRGSTIQEAVSAVNSQLVTTDGTLVSLSMWDVVRAMFFRGGSALTHKGLLRLLSATAGARVDPSRFGTPAAQRILDILEKFGLLTMSREQRAGVSGHDSIYAFSDYGKRILKAYSTPLDIIKGF